MILRKMPPKIKDEYKSYPKDLLRILISINNLGVFALLYVEPKYFTEGSFEFKAIDKEMQEFIQKKLASANSTTLYEKTRKSCERDYRIHKSRYELLVKENRALLANKEKEK